MAPHVEYRNRLQKECSRLHKTRQMSETLALGILLAAVGGFLDAYTYLCRGRVFANAQTGNIVLLGMNLAQGRLHESEKYLIPILAFAGGIVVAELVRTFCKRIRLLHWRQIVIAFEIILLLGVTFIPQSEGLNMLTNIMVSFVCALQVQSFRKLNGNLFATTMCTGNLRSATEHLYYAVRHRDRRELQHGLEYFGVIVFFILGAMRGAVTAVHLGIRSMLIAILGLAVVFCMMFIEKW